MNNLSVVPSILVGIGLIAIGRALDSIAPLIVLVVLAVVMLRLPRT